MKKYFKVFLLCTFLLFAFTGCNKDDGETVPELPQYNTESTSISTEEQSEASESKDKNGFYPEGWDTPRMTLLDEDLPRYDDSFTGFSGINNLSETPMLGNSQQNLTSCTAYCGIICNNNGDFYYTALGYDNFLHRKRNGGDEVFLEKTVWGINIINDKMYCIMDSEAPVQNPHIYSVGDIYSVDLNTGEMTLILATNACALAVFEDEMHFIYQDEWDYINGASYSQVFKCDLNGENILPRDSSFLGYIGDYYIGFGKYDQNNCLINAKTGEKICFTDCNLVYNFTVENGYCYYQLGGAGLYCMDPSNGEVTPMYPDESFNIISYKTSETHTETFEFQAQFIGGHCIINGDAYLVNQEFAFKVSPDGETELYHTPLKIGHGWHYEGLFSDGEKMYSVKYNLSSKQYKLVELQFTDEEFVEGIKTVKEIDLL